SDEILATSGGSRGPRPPGRGLFLFTARRTRGATALPGRDRRPGGGGPFLGPPLTKGACNGPGSGLGAAHHPATRRPPRPLRQLRAPARALARERRAWHLPARHHG